MINLVLSFTLLHVAPGNFKLSCTGGRGQALPCPVASTPFCCSSLITAPAAPSMCVVTRVPTRAGSTRQAPDSCSLPLSLADSASTERCSGNVCGLTQGPAPQMVSGRVNCSMQRTHHRALLPTVTPSPKNLSSAEGPVCKRQMWGMSFILHPH